MGDRRNVPAGQRTAFMGSILTEGGIPLEKATLSIKSKWTADFKKEKKERLPILVSGLPDFEEGKVLGIPVITNTTGEEQARTTFSLANEWEISDNVRSFVFDATATNSRWKTEACVRLENFFDKKLFMLACRHHIFERILSSVHKELFCGTSGTEYTNSIELRDFIWSTIYTEACFKTLEIKDRSLKLTNEHSMQSLEIILSTPNRKNLLPRFDYRECAELMLILLGETPERGIHWLKPRAEHRTRWMPSILYPAKMFAFSAQAGYDKDMISKLEALCKFNALFSVKNWLPSLIGAHASYKDFKLWHDLSKYCSHPLPRS
ncbi:hypothetical protein AVEN_59007-1 [Araneus ventricosus]|uniref:Uncharacterized protein n=1 Tax=Araneus ventricosus TaxID=182803 RepID=A0A4Y2U0V1_ARAVE|nr:hypothetical protein AVEN_5730-1 [Araneus ventricosus]GBO06608.1 hypothetical protein AVEN_59007-1 [Araneus ventricosus]